MKLSKTLIAVVLAAVFFAGMLGQAAVAWAAVVPFTETGHSVQGTHDGSGEIAKMGAKMDAVQKAQDKAGVYVSSLSVTKESAISQDDIVNIINDVKRIDEQNIKYETSILGDGDVQTLKYSATVTVYIDTDSLQSNIDTWKRQEEQKRQSLISAVEGKRKAIEDLRQTIINAETMIKQGADKNAVQNKLTEIENETLAIQKYNQGIDLQQQGNYHGAIERYSEAVQIKPDYDYAYYIRGFCYDEIGHLDKALDDYDKALQLNPRLFMVYNGRAIVNIRLGNFEQAVLDFDECIKHDSDPMVLAAAYINRGELYLNHLKNYRSAISDFSYFIDHYDINSDAGRFLHRAYSNRAYAYLCTGDTELALSDYTSSLKIKPTVAAYANRGTIYMNKENYQAAIVDYTRLIEYESANPKAHLDADVYKYGYRNRGICYYRIGRYKEAIADFTEYIRLDSKNAQVWYLRSFCYQELGDKEKAAADEAKGDQLS
ncbi:MAG: tetratricopeptide repeat protein [Selenomonas sp.]|nr:tetratricopeptide repeat protein [Selenomonas sp.]